MLEGLKWLFSLVVGRRRKEKVPLIDLRAPPQVKTAMDAGEPFTLLHNSMLVLAALERWPTHVLCIEHTSGREHRIPLSDNSP